jgi:hypothetical protein
MIREYVRLVLFSAGLLIGVQVPSFVDQYQKRVDAQLVEASHSLGGFQRTADRYFHGDVGALADHYDASADPVFRQDANSIRAIAFRVHRLRGELTDLAQPWYGRVFHVAFEHDPDIFRQALAQYSYTVPLDQQAIAWGLGVGFGLSLLLEMISLVAWKGVRLMCRGRPRPEAA